MVCGVFLRVWMLILMKRNLFKAQIIKKDIRKSECLPYSNLISYKVTFLGYNLLCTVCAFCRIPFLRGWTQNSADWIN